MPIFIANSSDELKHSGCVEILRYTYPYMVSLQTLILSKYLNGLFISSWHLCFSIPPLASPVWCQQLTFSLFLLTPLSVLLLCSFGSNWSWHQINNFSFFFCPFVSLLFFAWMALVGNYENWWDVHFFSEEKGRGVRKIGYKCWWKGRNNN